MQRIYLISAAAAIAIVAILLVGRGSKTSWVEVGGPEGSDDGDGSAASLGGGQDMGGLDSDAGGGAASGGARRGLHGGERGAGGGRASGGGERDRGLGTGRRGGAAAVVGGGQRSGGGVVGQGVGRRGDGPTGSVSVAGGGTGPGDVKLGGSRDRSRVMEFLAEPSKGGGGGTEKTAEGGAAGDDVVLSVPLTRDTGVQAADATAPVAEQDLKFADDGVGVHFEPGSVLAFPDAGNMKGDAGSLQLDVDPEWSGSDGGDFALVNVRTPNDPSNLLRIFKNGRYLRFIFADSSGQERDISTPIDDWQPGEQRRITATWGDGTTNLYIDGQLAGHNTYENPFEIRPGTPLYLGSDVPQAPAAGASATISNFQVFGRALQVDEMGNR